MATQEEYDAQVAAAQELLLTTKRNLQLVDEHLAMLGDGRVAVETAQDVSTEHRSSWLGVVDDLDSLDGVEIAASAPIGFGNEFKGTIRNQEDAAFVCTGILFAVAAQTDDNIPPQPGGDTEMIFFENPDADGSLMLMLRLTDANTGRNLINGSSVGPLDRDRGAIPVQYVSSVRGGLGSNVKNKLFAEFTIPRAGNVKVGLFNVAQSVPSDTHRIFVTLLGYKVYGA